MAAAGAFGPGFTTPRPGLRVWCGVAHVLAAAPPPVRLDLFALRAAGETVPLLALEAYDGPALVAGGEVALWELNQAIAALLSASTQARRLTLRDPRGHGGHLDVVADGAGAEVTVTSADRARRVAFGVPAATLVGDLNALVGHYLALSRATGPSRTLVPGDLPVPAVAAS